MLGFKHFLTSRYFSYSPFSLTRNFATASSSVLKVDNPYTGKIHCEIPLINTNEANKVLVKSLQAQKDFFNGTTLEDRQNICKEVVTYLQKNANKIGHDLSCMMGKPVKQAIGEVHRACERATALIEICEKPLSDENVRPDDPKFVCKIRKEPLGIILIISPWNYPLLCSINSIIPAILAGNSILLKLSSRTPLIADVFSDAFKSVSNIPSNLVLPLHCNHETTAKIIQNKNIGFVVFTGSVNGGYQIQQACVNRFIHCTLELGGKDPAYITEDCNIEYSVDNVIDGAMYNAGQSCCAVERLYIHKKHYDYFLENAKKLISNYNLGDPLNENTTMGPLAQSNTGKYLTDQVQDALNKGAEILIGEGKEINDGSGKGRFFSPTVLINCNHTMKIMKEESFGPVLPVQIVHNDNEAIELMNDSDYGLTASIFCNNINRVENISKYIETGTVYMNRCDYLDPYLPWGGVKETGKGLSLSSHCFNSFVKFKALHFKTKI